MNVPITITIDPEKRAVFESLKPVHGMTISGFLDNALEKYLTESSPVAIVKEKIAQTEAILAEQRQELLKAEVIEQQLKAQRKVVQQKEDVTDTYLEEMRNQKFEASKSSIINLWKRGDMSWPRIVDLYQFKNVAEAREWFTRKMAEVDP